MATQMACRHSARPGCNKRNDGRVSQGIPGHGNGASREAGPFKLHRSALQRCFSESWHDRGIAICVCCLAPERRSRFACRTPEIQDLTRIRPRRASFLPQAVRKTPMRGPWSHRRLWSHATQAHTTLVIHSDCFGLCASALRTDFPSRVLADAFTGLSLHLSGRRRPSLLVL
jgi:hypothetical protein